MHTLLVFLSIIGGLKLFGILGIIYGPLVVTAFLTLSDIYESSYRRIVEPGRETKKFLNGRASAMHTKKLPFGRH